MHKPCLGSNSGSSFPDPNDASSWDSENPPYIYLSEGKPKKKESFLGNLFGKKKEKPFSSVSLTSSYSMPVEKVTFKGSGISSSSSQTASSMKSSKSESYGQNRDSDIVSSDMPKSPDIVQLSDIDAKAVERQKRLRKLTGQSIPVHIALASPPVIILPDLNELKLRQRQAEVAKAILASLNPFLDALVDFMDQKSTTPYDCSPLFYAGQMTIFHAMEIGGIPMFKDTVISGVGPDAASRKKRHGLARLMWESIFAHADKTKKCMDLEWTFGVEKTFHNLRYYCAYIKSFLEYVENEANPMELTDGELKVYRSRIYDVQKTLGNIQGCTVSPEKGCSKDEYSQDPTLQQTTDLIRRYHPFSKAQ